MTDLELLLHELQALPEPITRQQLLNLLRSFAGRRLHLSKRILVRPDDLRLAAHLLTVGMERHETAKALVERLQVSESTAYRIIRQALTVHRPSRPPRPTQMELLR